MKGIHYGILALGLMLSSGLWAAATAKQLAEEAYYTIERAPLNLAEREKAQNLIQRAYAQDSNEPWVAIAQSRLTLIDGYRVGQRHNLKSYDRDAVELSKEQAAQAVKNAPDQAMAHIQLAMALTILGELRSAWNHLNTADSLDEASFYPWYLRTVIAIHKKDESFAKRGFNEIEKRISHDYQRRLLLQEKMRLTKITKDIEERERLHQATINLDPNDAYAWGNYGSFLLAQKRYHEAVHYLEKAVSLKPYGLATSQLATARSQLEQNDSLQPKKICCLKR